MSSCLEAPRLTKGFTRSFAEEGVENVRQQLLVAAEKLDDHQQSLKIFLSEWAQRQEELISAASSEVSLLAMRQKLRAAPSENCRPHLDTGLSERGKPTREVADVLRTPLEPSVGATDSGDYLPVSKSAIDFFRSAGSFIREKKSVHKMVDHATHSHKVQDLLHALSLDEVALPASKSDFKVCRLLAQFQQSNLFSAVCAFIILANTVLLAVAAEQSVHRAIEPGADVFLDWAATTEFCFCLFYTFEICLRIVVFRAKFLFSSDWGWNIFDVILVLMAWPDVIAGLLQRIDGHNPSYLRFVRVLKMLKLLRVLRLLSHFREFRLLMESLLGSVQSIVWSFGLIVVLTFMFSVGFMQAHADYMDDVLRGLRGPQDEVTLAFRDYWNSMSASMISLYMASTGGSDWQPIAMPLRHAGISYYLAFLFYVGVFLFVIMNTITSLFVDSLARTADKDEVQMIQDQLSRKEDLAKKITALFEEMSPNERGTITYQDFRSCLSDRRILAFASTLGLEINDLHQFFGILSQEGARAVDVDTFVIGCIKLKGVARSIDVVDLLINQRSAREDHERFVCACGGQFEDIRSTLARLLAGSSGPHASCKEGLGLSGALAAVGAHALTVGCDP